MDTAVRAHILAGTAAAALLLNGAGAAPAQAPDTIAFCLSADNPPLASAESVSGVDVELARALAGQLGAEARFVWLGAAEDEVLASPVDALREGRCDAALGAVVPHEPIPASGTLPRGITFSRPYYEIGYVLVRSAGSPPARTLEEVGGERVGVEREGLANLLLRQRGRKVYTLEDAETIVAEMAEGEIDYGYLWGPVAAWELRGRTDIVVAPEFEPVDRWPVALALREQDVALREGLNAAIARLTEGGTVTGILTAHGVPDPGSLTPARTPRGTDGPSPPLRPQ